jgi:hypothetical protein
MFELPTPSYKASSSGPSRPPSQLNTILSSVTTSNTNPHTPNKRQKTKENQGQIGFQMSLNGLLMEDFDAFEEASDFKRYVEELIDDPRGSTMKAASLKKARETARVYKWVTEATFLYHMIPILQGDGYHVDVKPEFKPGEEELSRQEDPEWKSFLSDEKIIVTLNQDFSMTLLHSKLSQNPVLVKGIAEELAKDTGMTNPRPDLTYSIQRDVRALTADTSIPEHILDLIEVSPGGHHTFLIIEGKNHAGSSATGENQARRGGATLVLVISDQNTCFMPST